MAAQSDKTDVELYLERETFYCKQIKAKISLDACSGQIEKAKKSIELIGKNLRGLKGQKHREDCNRALFQCSGCKDGMVNGQLKGGVEKYLKDLQGKFDKHASFIVQGDCIKDIEGEHVVDASVKDRVLGNCADPWTEVH